jgi:tetratricopeptide (TPR) repeat protein/transcriptional regulator with XRE-family HTH domain
MRTFADLLSEYMTRTGVSDAELARAIGVQRQTIFRWKEGLVARPRAAEDVLRCAAKLRLTAEERDRLLLAAGFPPEAPPPLPASDLQMASIEAPAQPPTSPEPAAADDLPDGRAVAPPEPAGMAPVAQDGILRYAAIIIAVVAILSVAAWLIWRSRDSRYPIAGPGETLVVVGQFANYTGGVQGYNVADRLQTALKRELDAARLPSARAAVWPEVIPDEAAALAVSRRAAAALVIWGEYDSGRVVGRFTLPPMQADKGERRYEKLLASPNELSAVINADLPEEVRYLSLLTLGQLYAGQGDHGRARAALVQALTRPPADRGALAALHFLLGYVQQTDQPAAGLDRMGAAIESYTTALALQPALISAHSNRASAYLRRDGPGDLAAAVADLTAVIAVWPEDAAPYVNRGAAYLRRKRPGDLEAALADLDRAVALAPETVAAYFNRGLARIRANDAAGWQADLTQTLALDPDHAGAYAALCWGYALDRQAATALPYCDRAVARAPSGPGRDSRGIVYAELGRFAEAGRDIAEYLRGDLPPAERAERTRWLTDLAAGRDSFDRATLDRLRGE